MDGKRLLSSIRLTNLLSFGPQGVELELQPLNVLIGANASGKSNLIEAVRLLPELTYSSGTRHLFTGGALDWFFKGGDAPSREARRMSLRVEAPVPDAETLLVYSVTFEVGEDQRSLARIVDESVTSAQDGFEFYRMTQGRPVVMNVREEQSAPIGVHQGRRPRDRVPLPEESVLASYRDSVQFPEITYIARIFSQMRFRVDWHFGRDSATRARMEYQVSPFRADDSGDFAFDIAALLGDPETKSRALAALQELYDGIVDVRTIEGDEGTEIVIDERGLRSPVSTRRLSDGTLRFIQLLSVLLDPYPPPLLCVEEPELGLHPDAVVVVARLLTELSHRTQLVVTTHSDVLVSGLSHSPEAVVICERMPEGTQFERLDPAQLAVWLEKYSLGDLWMRGDLGARRW